jgi:putative oxidoreductase
MKTSDSHTSCGDGAALLLRLTLAVVLFPHGAQKLLGWFGGYGFGGTMHFFETGLHIPAVFAFLAIMIEFFGPLFLLAGFFTRAAAFLMGLEMLVALFKGGHYHNGFFMNWMGQAHGEGFEFHILFIGMALAIVALGAGRYSLEGAREAAPAS